MAFHKLPTVTELIRQYSKARVIVPDTRVKLMGLDPFNGTPVFTRQLTDQDVRDAMVRQYAK